MPLPIIIPIVGSALAALFGAKKGFDAYDTNQEADRTNSAAQETFDSAKRSLKEARDMAQEVLSSLGRLKLETWRDQMGQFVEVFQKIRNVELEGGVDGLANGKLSMKDGELAKMKELSGYALEALSGGAQAIGAGALVGVASYGGAMMFASASTGTAIATLSGAAATNATLAFFGGGSLAAGGAGMAGGAMVLGGLVAGPALAVFGFVMSAAADKKLAQARVNLSNAKQAAAELDASRASINGVTDMARSFSKTINRLYLSFDKVLDSLEAVIDARGTDYQRYSKAQRETVYQAVQFAHAMKKLLETPLLDKEGAPRTAALNEALRGTQNLPGFEA